MPSPMLTIQLPDGSLSLSLPVEGVQRLQTELQDLKHRLTVVATEAIPKTDANGTAVRTKPQPQAPWEYQHIGDVFVEVFCNPNIWPTPFAAKVLLTVRDERLKLTTEVSLSRLIEDVSSFLE
jgi:hypothetical protein